MKALRCIIYSLFLAGIIAQAGCENNLKDVEQISSKKLKIPVDRSTGVVLIYSDSAIVKAKLITPELLHFKTDKPYYEMKKGVTVIFFDAQQQETSRIKADYGIQRENEKVIELKKNVVVTNIKGETFKSDELTWDENKKRFYSNKLVSITSKTNVLYGTSFWADESFSYYEITQSTGDLSLTEKQGF
jgi:LPS export ABC transporter protein LptC